MLQRPDHSMLNAPLFIASSSASHLLPSLDRQVHAAISGGDLPGLHRLVEHGANVAARDADGYFPLSFAVVNAHAPIVTMLLEQGADPLAVDVGGLCPLELAETLGHDPIIEMFLSHLGFTVRPMSA